MCIACEMSFWDMVEALPQDARERVLREQAAAFGCDVPDGEAAEPAAQPAPDERKP
jgi:hypothetical protein